MLQRWVASHLFYRNGVVGKGLHLENDARCTNSHEITAALVCQEAFVLSSFKLAVAISRDPHNNAVQIIFVFWVTSRSWQQLIFTLRQIRMAGSDNLNRKWIWEKHEELRYIGVALMTNENTKKEWMRIKDMMLEVDGEEHKESIGLKMQLY